MPSPNFTDVKVFIHADATTNLKASASCKVADILYIRDLKVVLGKNGYFVGMASRKDAKGEYQDIYFPGSKALRDELSHEIMAAFKLGMAAAGTPIPDKDAPPASKDEVPF